MKHLKSFRIFESSSEDDLLGTINDIFLPISDSGIEYEINNFGDIGLIHIKINGQSGMIDDCVEHLENYLKDLGHGYFVGRSIENETHISIENNFSEVIEKNFLEIIDGVREVKTPSNDEIRLWVSPESNDVNYCLFNQNGDHGLLYFDQHKIWLPFKEYGLKNQEVYEVVRYLVGKHLKLESLTPEVSSRVGCAYVGKSLKLSLHNLKF